MGEITVREYLAMAKATPTGRLHYEAVTAETNSEYLAAVNRALKLALGEIVSNRRHKQGHSEDALNTELVSLLRFSGISAMHDVKYGGHTDISVRLGDEFLWIAEAKIWSGCAWAFSGLKQLGRYMSGIEGQQHGAIILYVFGEDACQSLTDWHDRIAKLSKRILNISAVAKLAFWSKHRHLAAGTEVTIDHIAVPLHWNGKSDAV